MKTTNIHHRIISQPKEKIVQLFNTLASKDDLVWPYEKWPRMKLNKGLAIGSKGGHGPIRYQVVKFEEGKNIEFKFSKPNGFDGVHGLTIKAIDENQTKLTHYIKMDVSGTGWFAWSVAIRWLHDALIEDAFDKVENSFNSVKKRTEWSWWVKLLRNILQ